MADTTVGAESAQANPATFDELYKAYRYTKAEWDLALYDPSRGDEDLPEEVNNRLMDAHCRAFDDFMLAPIQTMPELLKKMTVFRDEDGQDLTKASLFVAALTEDTRRVYFGDK